LLGMAVLLLLALLVLWLTVLACEVSFELSMRQTTLTLLLVSALIVLLVRIVVRHLRQKTVDRWSDGMLRCSTRNKVWR